MTCCQSKSSKRKEIRGIMEINRIQFQSNQTSFLFISTISPIWPISCSFCVVSYNCFMDRRTVLARMVQILSGFITALFAAPVFSFFRASFTSDSTESSYPIASIDSITDEITRVSFTRLVRDGWMTHTAEDYVWVRKRADGGVVVFEPHCTHLGCAYDWDPKKQQFLCPCHGGKFDKDGNRVAGPPPRPLDQLETKVVGNQIRVGKIKKA